MEPKRTGAFRVAVWPDPPGEWKPTGERLPRGKHYVNVRSRTDEPNGSEKDEEARDNLNNHSTYRMNYNTTWHSLAQSLEQGE